MAITNGPPERVGYFTRRLYVPRGSERRHPSKASAKRGHLIARECVSASVGRVKSKNGLNSPPTVPHSTRLPLISRRRWRGRKRGE